MYMKLVRYGGEKAPQTTLYFTNVKYKPEIKIKGQIPIFKIFLFLK